MKLKPGYTTTEFWTTVIATLLQGGLAAAGMIDHTWAAVGITVINAVYPLLRFGLKANAQKQADTTQPTNG